MDSLYKGCPKITVLNCDYKIYGKNMLTRTRPELLYSRERRKKEKIMCDSLGKRKTPRALTSLRAFFDCTQIQ